jgi:hypothetical protein
MHITRMIFIRLRLPELFWGRWLVAWLDMHLATVIRIIAVAVATTNVALINVAMINMEAIMVGITTIMDIINEVVTIEDTVIDTHQLSLSPGFLTSFREFRAKSDGDFVNQGIQ